MKDKFSELISEYPFYVGSFASILGVSYLIYKIGKRESFKMKDYSAASWKALVNSWALIFMLIMLGLALIFKE
jgi:hypothetical protein